ncbi:MAG: hypothetical protein AAF528_09970 [Cyanobacteria bacterium P01_C01_bin.121]
MEISKTMDLPPPIQSESNPIVKSADVRPTNENANLKVNRLRADEMNQSMSEIIRPEKSCNNRKAILTCDLSEGSDSIVSHQVISSQSSILNEGPAQAITPFDLTGSMQTPSISGNWQFFGASVNQELQTENQADDVVKKMDSGQLWVVNSRRRNGLIVVREFHAEFAGPGAAVGGSLDEDVVKVIPIGNLSLLEPDSHEAHQNAIKIRLQWIRLTQNFTDQPEPNDRARMILEQFKTYFDQATVDMVPDEAFAMLVGVLPQTIRRVRSGFVW